MVWEEGGKTMGYLPPGASEKESGGLSVLRERVQISRSGVEESVGGGCGGRENDGVDDRGQDWHPRTVDCDDPW